MPFPPYAAGVNPRESLPEDPPLPTSLDYRILGSAYAPGRGYTVVYAPGREPIAVRDDAAVLIEAPFTAFPPETGIWSYGDGSPQWTKALLGYAATVGGGFAAVYSHDAMVDIHIEEYGQDFANDQDAGEAAMEDISFNVEGAWYGPTTPFVVHLLCRSCGVEGFHGNPCAIARLGR